MDEESLKSDLNMYQQQLMQVNQAIQVSGGSEDLVKLKADLTEVIQLTEASLLSLVKSRLLGSLEDETPTQYEQSDMDTEMAAFKAAIGETSESSLPPETEDPASPINHSVFNEVIGRKCRAPYTQEWGVMQYHNGLVLAVEGLHASDAIPMVRVVFCYPTHQSMLPCPYYLEGNCKFTDEQCRYSHGHLVALEELREFEDADYSLLSMEAPCLAKYTDGIWYKGMIVDVKKDHKFLVKYDTYNETIEVGLEEVIPIDEGKEEINDDVEENIPDTGPVDSSDEEDLPVFLWKPPKTLDALGQWEVHTKGIGSQLMAKMGYITGQGLGKNSDGRAEPIPIQLLPQGKSLDKIMELKDTAGDQDLYDVMKRQEKKKKLIDKKVHAGYIAKGVDVFDFINQRLGGKKGRVRDLLPQQISSKKTASRQISETDLHSKSDRHINIQLLKTTEEMKKTQREMSRLKQSLSRNIESDRGVASKIQEKLTNLESYLSKLQASEKTMQSHQQRRSDHKKLTIF